MMHHQQHEQASSLKTEQTLEQDITNVYDRSGDFVMSD